MILGFVTIHVAPGKGKLINELIKAVRTLYNMFIASYLLLSERCLSPASETSQKKNRQSQGWIALFQGSKVHCMIYNSDRRCTEGAIFVRSVSEYVDTSTTQMPTRGSQRVLKVQASG